MSMFNTNEPRTPGGRMGDGMEEMFLDEAKQDHLANEAERADAEEDRERAELGESVTPKRPWWKFWA
jgi:hypothetical protein